MKRNNRGTPPALDEATCSFGAGVLLAQLRALAEEVDAVRAGRPDIEHVHRARVASRRLRAALPLFLPCLPKKAGRWTREIRAVTGALGEARDTDVQFAWVVDFYRQAEDPVVKPGVARLALRLHQQREALQPAVKAAMKHLDKSDTVTEMQDYLSKVQQRGQGVYQYSPALYQHSYHAIHNELAALLAYDAIVTQPEKVAELHEMRIQAKRLRYTMDIFAGLYASQLKPHLQAVRKAQDLLGEIHDCDIWQLRLADFLAAERKRVLEFYGHERPFAGLVPGVFALQAERRQQREARYAEFTHAWQGWQAEGIWEQLQEIIQAPYLRVEGIYPLPGQAAARGADEPVAASAAAEDAAADAAGADDPAAPETPPAA